MRGRQTIAVAAHLDVGLLCAVLLDCLQQLQHLLLRRRGRRGRRGWRGRRGRRGRRDWRDWRDRRDALGRRLERFHLHWSVCRGVSKGGGLCTQTRRQAHLLAHPKGGDEHLMRKGGQPAVRDATQGSRQLHTQAGRVRASNEGHVGPCVRGRRTERSCFPSGLTLSKRSMSCSSAAFQPAPSVIPPPSLLAYCRKCCSRAAFTKSLRRKWDAVRLMLRLSVWAAVGLRPVCTAASASASDSMSLYVLA